MGMSTAEFRFVMEKEKKTLKEGRVPDHYARCSKCERAKPEHTFVASIEEPLINICLSCRDAEYFEAIGGEIDEHPIGLPRYMRR